MHGNSRLNTEVPDERLLLSMQSEPLTANQWTTVPIRFIDKPIIDEQKNMKSLQLVESSKGKNKFKKML